MSEFRFRRMRSRQEIFALTCPNSDICYPKSEIMSSRLFLVNVEPPEIRVAEVRDGRLFDLDIERGQRLLGNIYKGRVENIVTGMDAAFVDIGHKRNALLYVGDIVSEKIGPINQLIQPRQEILVQVARPPVGTKGARVTSRLSLPGRAAILVAGGDGTGVSKRISSEEERTRLRRIADRLRPLDHGVIIRTEADGLSEAQIGADIALLLRQLNAIIANGRESRAPALVHEDLGLLGRIARDRLSDDVSAIYIDSRSVVETFAAQIRELAPQLARLIQFYDEPTPLFERFGVARDVELAAQRSVPLPRGGSIAIDEAEALVAIDVNTGSFTSKKGLAETVVMTNLEAVEEIARQLRTRDLGGIIVVDFIDMDKTRDRVKVLNALENALKDDRNRTRIVQVSPSGLVEMTRRRESQSLRTALGEPCPRCGGSGFVARGESVAIDARRQIRALSIGQNGEQFIVQLHPATACDFIGEDGEWTRALERETDAKIWVRADEMLPTDCTHIERIAMNAPKPRDLAVGALLPLPASARFYPAQGPQFCVLNQTLIALDSLPEKTEGVYASGLIEIVETGRHFVIGKLVS